MKNPKAQPLPKNYLEVGINKDGEVVINHPYLEPDPDGIGGHFTFNAQQARDLAFLLNKHADQITPVIGVNKWDQRFMNIAQQTALWSKHPHTKVGCVAADDEHRHLSGGFNGLPRGINDERLLDQSAEVSSTVHAEANLVAAAARPVLKGSTVYISEPPCAQCAALLIQAGVKRVVYKHNANLSAKWVASCVEGAALLQEAEVALDVVFES